MSEQLVVAVARIGLLVLLWIFVFTVVGVIRRDLFAGGAGEPPGGGAAGGRRLDRRWPTSEGQAGPRRPPAVVTAGALAGTRITLGEAPITIGRAEDSTLVITDDYSSARHARLVAAGRSVVH